MLKQDLIKLASDFVKNSEDNRIEKEVAISDGVVGLKIFEAPILAFGAADDPYFKVLKESQAIGEHFILPHEWLPNAKTVISFFLPFTEEIKRSNARDIEWPSEQWLHGRIEGQDFLNKLSRYLKSELINAGYHSLVPSSDKKFRSKWGTNTSVITTPTFTSNWSERHVAFVCGLGTFGLSKGLITSKGIAGRFGSIITELQLDSDTRAYEDIYEYCSMCGACVKNCPVNAITIDQGKDHRICSDFLDETAEKFKPRYGCGKCQVGVPCESGIPSRR